MKYDLVVIGSGAGLMVMEAALSLGLKCAIVEKSKFGGTCLTKGCIPSKMLVYPADLIREVEKAERIGLKISKPQIDWKKISERMWNQINFTKRIEYNLANIPNLDVYKGIAEFKDKNSIIVRYMDKPEDEITGDRIVIAVGAEPYVPSFDGLFETGYVTSETFFDDKFPAMLWKSIAIIGGGAISAEFAHILSAYGVNVTVILRSNKLLRSEEEEISEFVKKQFEENGIRVLTDRKILSVAKGRKGKVIKTQNEELEIDEIFVASGLKSPTYLLKPEKAGIEVDEKGWIKTNEYLETSQKHIWAIGDINGKYQFRHKANYEAEILINNLFSNNLKKVTYDSVPWTIFTHPQVAHVGMTEREVKEKGIEYTVAVKHYSEVVGGIAMGYNNRSSDNGFVKLIVGKDHKILGAHIVGPNAAILVQPYVYLMNAGGTYDPINESMVIHPSLNELTAWVLGNIIWD